MGITEAPRTVLATRARRPKFMPDAVQGMIAPFFDFARPPYGLPMVIIDPNLSTRTEVHSLAEDRKAHVVYSAVDSNAPEGISPAEMINAGMRRARKMGYRYFGIISGELAKHIPRVVPEMIRQLEEDPELATVGVAIDTVHDMDLVHLVEEKGMQVITPDNYALVLPNNAFSIHRVTTDENGHLLEDYLFEELYERELGYIEIAGKKEPLQYNEEVARMLRQIRTRPLKMLLLASAGHLIQRDESKSISTSNIKRERRQAAAHRYRDFSDYEVSNEELADYLQNNYKIDFALAA